MAKRTVWGGCLLLSVVVSVLLAASRLCSGAAVDVTVSLSEAPRRVSGSSSAVFAFRVMLLQSGGVGSAVVTCKLDGGRASECGSPGNNGNGTGTVSYQGLGDGSHAFAVCASSRGRGRGVDATCATYAWDVDTIPPTASVTVEGSAAAFTSASNVSALISFSEPCDGFTCNHTYCNLIVYGPGRVEPSTLKVLRPGLRYSVAVAISPDEQQQYGRLILVMGRGFCTDAAGHRFTRTSNSSFTLRFDTRSDSMNITTSIPQKLIQTTQGVKRLVEATNDAKDLRIYLSFAQPVLNSSAEILSVLKATGNAVLTPTTNRSTLGNRRFGYVVNKVSDPAAIVTLSCDTSSIISRQGTPVHSAEPFTFLYDTKRPWVKLGTSTRRTSSHDIQVLIKFAKPVFNFSSSAVQLSGGNLLRFHEASKSIYTLQIQAVDKLVSVQVAENAAQDVAGNPNLASDRLQVRHYSVPASSSSVATLTTVIFVVTAVVATLLTVSTSSLLASGAIPRPSSYMISEPSRNLLRMACHIQIFALSRWLSVNLPIEYYEFTKGIEWTIPYMYLPWEGPAADDPFLGYSSMPAVAYSELLQHDRSALGLALADDVSYPRAQQSQQIPIIPTEIPGDGRPMMPTEDRKKPVMPMQVPLDLNGKPLTAMEYRSFFENPDMKPEAQIIMKLQDLDGWKYFGRNMLWLGVIGGGLILAHALTLEYLKLRYRDKPESEQGKAAGYGALVLPRLEIMVLVLAMPCISQAAAALISGGTTGGQLAVGIVLTGILTCLLVGLVLFLSLGIAMGRLLQYKEVVVVQEGEDECRCWYQELTRRILGPGKRGQWTWKDPRRSGCVAKLGPLFEDLRGPPAVYVVTQIAAGGKRGAAASGAEGRITALSEGETEAPQLLTQQTKVLGVLRICFTFLEWTKRVAVGFVAGAHASSYSYAVVVVVVLSIASLQLLLMLFTKPFIKKRVQLVETVSVASEVVVFASCLVLSCSDDRDDDVGEESVVMGLAMLGVFLVGFAAQACNEWNALFRQVRLLSADRSSSSFVEGAKTASAGLLLLVLPSSVVMGDRPRDTDFSAGPDDGESVAAAQRQREKERGSNERWWLRQLREMAKASFSKEEKEKASSSKTTRSRSRVLYNDLESIFSNNRR